MSNLLFVYMKNPAIPIVFDIDGTLTHYGYGKRSVHHELDSEETAAEFKRVNVYENADALPLVQRFAAAHGVGNVFCLSIESHGKEDEKSAFVTQHYGIERNRIAFVKNEDQKIEVLNRLYGSIFANTKRPVYVDDDANFLRRVENETNFLTAHVTVFFTGLVAG